MSYSYDLKKMFAVLLGGAWAWIVLGASEPELRFLAWLLGSLRHHPGW